MLWQSNSGNVGGFLEAQLDLLRVVDVHRHLAAIGQAAEQQLVGALEPAGDDRADGLVERRCDPSAPPEAARGVLLGAAGALEAVFSILCVREGRVPPTINLDNLDPTCKELGLDFTAHHAVEKNVNYALSNSFGFGGTNSSLIFGKV